MSDTVKVAKLPFCQVCKDGTRAAYDAATTQGPWAYLCQRHFELLGIGLGTGRGQLLIVEGDK